MDLRKVTRSMPGRSTVKRGAARSLWEPADQHGADSAPSFSAIGSPEAPPCSGLDPRLRSSGGTPMSD